MEEIYLSPTEQAAITAVDAEELDRLMDLAIRDERLDGLHRLALRNCGTYIASKFDSFGRTLLRHREAKSAKKRVETEYDVQRASQELSFAVRQMKDRARAEHEEKKLFSVDERSFPSFRLSSHLDVVVSYRWRRDVSDEWAFGSISFTYDVNLRPDYSSTPPKRKPSARKREEDVQARLYREWEHLRMLALCSVRDYFRSGGDGKEISKSFKVVVDSYTGGLNNFSAKFWEVRV